MSDPCFPPQCQNDGVCWRNADATDFLCQCASGYRGIYCEEVLPSGPAPIECRIIHAPAFKKLKITFDLI